MPYLVKQRKKSDCGVACAAMLTGSDYESAWAAGAAFMISTEGEIPFERLPVLFEELGFESEIQSVAPKGSPQNGLCEITYERNGTQQWHYIVWDGESQSFLDPQTKPARTFKITRFLCLRRSRCGWVGHGKPFYEHYHDHEWGVPVHDERHLFEMLILEGAQAGLSWETILKRRDAYRATFLNFEPAKVAAMSDEALEEILQNPAIIRNRLKVFSARKNARAFLDIQKEFGSFDAYVWGFVGGKPIQNSFATLADMPACTAQSTVLSKDLKKRGMSFVGPTIIYAYMQAIGMVNDHITSCFRHAQLGGKTVR